MLKNANDLVFITKAKDMSFMVKAKSTDLCCPDVKDKTKDTFLSRTFQGRLLTQYFIIYYSILCRPKIYK